MMHLIAFTYKTDGKSILAMCLLYYLLPDTRARSDHRRVLTLKEVYVDSMAHCVLYMLLTFSS